MNIKQNLIVEPGKFLAFGSSAEIYEFGEDKIIKLYYHGVPDIHKDYEFSTGKLIHDAGIPSPIPYQIVQGRNRNGIVYERIQGLDLRTELHSKPWKLVQLAKELAEVHSSFQKFKIPELACHKSVLESRLETRAHILGKRMEALRAILKSLEFGEDVIHGDFHFANVIRSSEGRMMSIDWPSASKGTFLADVAKTYVGIRYPRIREGTPFYVKVITPIFGKTIAEVYLKEYRKRVPFTDVQLKDWLIIATACKIKEDRDTNKRIQSFLKFIDSLLVQSQLEETNATA